MREKDLLVMKDLVTSFYIGGKYYPAVDGVSLSIKEKEVFALVGESGCGKSALALSILQLHNAAKTKVTGNIYFRDQDLLAMTNKELNQIRGKEISMIFQDPLTALNPLMRIGDQIEEGLLFHLPISGKERKKRAMELLKDVGMENPSLIYQQFPHELSGGMRQRAMIAIALACKPALVIADEPTTALDVTIQAQILELLKKLQKEIQSGILLITHDLGVVAEMAHKVAVMYAGQIVEIGTVKDIFSHPLHPYTRSLLASVPEAIHKNTDGSLHVIGGTIPSLSEMNREGCRFAPRIPWIKSSSHEKNPGYHQVSTDHLVLCTCYKDFYLQ